MAKDYKRKETCVNVQNRELPHVITMGHGKRHKYSQEKNKKKKKKSKLCCGCNRPGISHYKLVLHEVVLILEFVFTYCL